MGEVQRKCPKISYNVKEAAEAVGVDETTIRRAIKSGDIAAKWTSLPKNPGTHAGKLLISVAELNRWFADLPDAY